MEKTHEERIWELFEELKNACECMIFKNHNLLMKTAKDESEAKPTCSTCRYWRWEGVFLLNAPNGGYGDKTGTCSNNFTEEQTGAVSCYPKHEPPVLMFRENFCCHNYEVKPNI